jgi:hypothetical protein
MLARSRCAPARPPRTGKLGPQPPRLAKRSRWQQPPRRRRGPRATPRALSRGTATNPAISPEARMEPQYRCPPEACRVFFPGAPALWIASARRPRRRHRNRNSTLCAETSSCSRTPAVLQSTPLAGGMPERAPCSHTPLTSRKNLYPQPVGRPTAVGRPKNGARREFGGERGPRGSERQQHSACGALVSLSDVRVVLLSEPLSFITQKPASRAAPRRSDPAQLPRDPALAQTLLTPADRSAA